ncbi:MAG: YraN family protein [Patescibacteria group bacterium UBA2163]
MARHNEVGQLGEDIATQFLKRKGWQILARNFRKPYGEIDIIIQKGGITRFIEVKTVSHETNDQDRGNVSRENTEIRPEENLHPQKMRRLARVVNVYLLSHETEEWFFDLICVYLDEENRSAQVKWIKDIILT